MGRKNHFRIIPKLASATKSIVIGTVCMARPGKWCKTFQRGGKKHEQQQLYYNITWII
jgi:hypothetical protein